MNNVNNSNNEYNITDAYTPTPETTDKDEKRKNWGIAFGLQAVDYLAPSAYMRSLARANIEGEKSYDVVEQDLTTYYSDASNTQNTGEKEADEVSLRIVRLLNDDAFTFNYITLRAYHKFLFSGIDIGIDEKYIGAFRDYNITKDEPILGGKTVHYADHNMIEETLKYDFNEEGSHPYPVTDLNEVVKRVATFTSNIWQVHPFGNGNTRTVAVFIQKYLISKGFNVNNELFRHHSLYFRNALVKANFADYSHGIVEDDRPLIAFFENLLLGKSNTLDDEIFMKS